MYIGEKIRLREYRKSDIIDAQRYLNDSEIKKYIMSGIPYLYTLTDEEKWFENVSATKDTYNFAIETIEEKLYIGGCGIDNVDWKNSIVVVGIFIGNKEYLNKGYGTDAMNVLISFIFNQMNINKIKLNVYSFNERAIKSYKKSGFIIEGVLRDEIYRDGQYYDKITMGLLKKDFIKGLGEK